MAQKGKTIANLEDCVLIRTLDTFDYSEGLDIYLPSFPEHLIEDDLEHYTEDKNMIIKGTFYPSGKESDFAKVRNIVYGVPTENILIHA